jgi:hypothetical protein
MVILMCWHLCVPQRLTFFYPTVTKALIAWKVVEFSKTWSFTYYNGRRCFENSTCFTKRMTLLEPAYWCVKIVLNRLNFEVRGAHELCSSLYNECCHLSILGISLNGRLSCIHPRTICFIMILMKE